MLKQANARGVVKVFLRLDLGNINLKLASLSKIELELIGIKLIPFNVHKDYENMISHINGPDEDLVIKVEVLPGEKLLKIILKDLEFILLMRIIDEITWFIKILKTEEKSFTIELKNTLGFKVNLKQEQKAREKFVETQMTKKILITNAKLIIADCTNKNNEFFIGLVESVDVNVSKNLFLLKFFQGTCSLMRLIRFKSILRLV